ncbi:uncharacterized protein N0V89_001873 [Didymosphaeria variabile]|uniref:PIN domain-containing protein n=1 Tax=Didymosphaeria variabile TaxID=1932322 RepID=A0A9W8XSF3_9PLEO|nr:uncharacterized protein N0V89_001873 [Didymosphaeria variabile]KAJ4357298.1 hypothetical protein N0V89_001873 [Didymosphaeria variabile]
MRRNTFPPRPRPDDSRLRAPPEPPKRKIFNCIVDDTALIAGAKKSTRDGIRKWITQDAIPLAQLNHLKTGQERYNADARDALKWLDDVTSSPTIGDRIVLEGVEEAYNTWAEVEQFMLPETLLSMESSASEDEDDEDEYREDLESSFNALDVSDGTSMSSLDQSPKSIRTTETDFFAPASGLTDEKAQVNNEVTPVVDSPTRTARNSTELPRGQKSPKNGFPHSLRPLFNHILWRIHQESNPDAALDNFILLTNDPAKQTIAQKFGIRAKRLEQLRDAVMREDREFKNHLTVYKKETEEHAMKKESELEPKSVQRPKSSHSTVSKPGIDSDEEDCVLIKNAPRGPANGTASQRVFDPNDFGRTTQQHSPRGGRGNLAPRGRGGAIRGGRGAFAGRGRGGAYVPPAPVFQSQPAPRHDPNRPIDPDSFTRPVTRGIPVRGGRRTLWEPN